MALMNSALRNSIFSSFQKEELERKAPAMLKDNSVLKQIEFSDGRVRPDSKPNKYFAQALQEARYIGDLDREDLQNVDPFSEEIIAYPKRYVNDFAWYLNKCVFQTMEDTLYVAFFQNGRKLGRICLADIPGWEKYLFFPL